MYYHDIYKLLSLIEEDIARTYIRLLNNELNNRMDNKLLNDLNEHLERERQIFLKVISNEEDAKHNLDIIMNNYSVFNIGGLFGMDAQKYFLDKSADEISIQLLGMHRLYYLLNYRLIAYQNLNTDKQDDDIASSLPCNVYFMKEVTRILSLILNEYIEKHCNNFYQSRLMRIKYLTVFYTTINEDEMIKNKFDTIKIEPLNLEEKLMSFGYTKKQADKFIKFVSTKCFKDTIRRLLSFSDEAFYLNEVIVESLIYQAYIRTIMLQIKNQDYVKKLQMEVIKELDTLGTAISLNKAKEILLESFSHYENDCITYNSLYQNNIICYNDNIETENKRFY